MTTGTTTGTIKHSSTPRTPVRTSRYPRRGAPHLRLRIGFVLIAMVLSVFGARLVQLQGIDPGSYAAMAAAESMQDVVLPATRGDILDRNGEPLADTVEGLMVVADPAQTAEGGIHSSTAFRFAGRPRSARSLRL